MSKLKRYKENTLLSGVKRQSPENEELLFPKAGFLFFPELSVDFAFSPFFLFLHRV